MPYRLRGMELEADTPMADYIGKSTMIPQLDLQLQSGVRGGDCHRVVVVFMGDWRSLDCTGLDNAP